VLRLARENESWGYRRIYADFYNNHRPHRTLNQAAPLRPLSCSVTDLDHFCPRPRTDPPKTSPGWPNQRVCARRLMSRRTAGHDAGPIFERHTVQLASISYALAGPRSTPAGKRVDLANEAKNDTTLPLPHVNGLNVYDRGSAPNYRNARS
jgi:hypothetical protein